MRGNLRDRALLVRCVAILLLMGALPASPGSYHRTVAASDHISPTASTVPERTGRVLVRFKPGRRDRDLSDVFQRAGGREVGRVRGIGVRVLAPDGGGVEALLSRLRRDPRVAYAEPELVRRASVTPNDPYLDRQWGHAKIQSRLGWDISKGSRAVKVAVVDTGIDQAHPDLRARYGGGYDFVDNDANPRDGAGHGTHVAGIVAASGDNGAGVAGVGWYTQIIAARVLDANGEGSDSTVSDGIVWAADNGAAVINLSLGGYGYSQTMADAVRYAREKGALLVAAAGNDSMSEKTYPAALPGVVGVAASTPSDHSASFSNFGGYVDISAPGESIYSTMPTYTVGMSYSGYAKNYDYMDGTSMAAPFVAGAAAVVKARYLGYTAGQVWDRLRQGAQDIGTRGWDPYTGHGRLNLYRALLADGQAYGVVKDARTGAPLAGAKVTLQGTSRHTFADSQGRYRLTAIPAGARTLLFTKWTYEPFSTALSVPSGGSAQADCALRPLARLTGYVKSSSGAPLSGATMRIVGTARTDTTDASGYYSISRAPLGARTVTASREGYNTRSRTATLTMGETLPLNFSLTPR